MRKFYKTVITVEVLSEDPYRFESLSGLEYDIKVGDCSGTSRVLSSKMLGRKAFIKEVKKQGSDPEFFQLNETGKDL